MILLYVCDTSAPPLFKLTYVGTAGASGFGLVHMLRGAVASELFCI